MSSERYVALALLAFCLGYGYMATEIYLLPFQAGQQVTARTMPYLLAAAGVLLSLLLLVSSATDGGGEDSKAVVLSRANIRRAALILLAVIVYGAIIRPAGFILSTLLFLFFCSYVLGERRLPLLAAIHVPIVLGFWLVMTQLLEQTL